MKSLKALETIAHPRPADSESQKPMFLVRRLADVHVLSRQYEFYRLCWQVVKFMKDTLSEQGFWAMERRASTVG